MSMPTGINPLSGRHVMIVAAHADDETIGAGGAMADANRITLVHVTDGGESLFRAWLKGFMTRAAYARARRNEIQNAMALLPLKVEMVTLDIHDMRAAYRIADIALRLKPLIRERQPDLVITHAYEGGHPDHDATAMAVHLAMRDLNPPCPLYEMAGYHRAGGRNVFGAFAQSGGDAICVALAPQAQARKSSMLATFVTQRNIVARFPREAEYFRPAPVYDFTKPVHSGTLFYEVQFLPMRRPLWNALVDRARKDFDTGNIRRHFGDAFSRLTATLSGYLSASAAWIRRS